MPIERRWIKITEIGPYTRSVNIRVRVISYGTERTVRLRKDKTTHRVAEVLVGDETGMIYLTLWDDQIDQIEAEKTYTITNGYANDFQGRLTLNVGRYGTLDKSDESIEQVNTDLNVSEEYYRKASE